MRKIDKGDPVPSVIAFVSQRHPQRWEEAKEESRAWRDYILEHEQHCLSGYTEERLRIDNSHIDHFRKRTLFNTLIFNWSNFIVDRINNDTYGAKYKDTVVKTSVENDRLINPVTENASRFFKYELNGKINVADGLTDEEKERAIYTRDAFNLNESSLVDRRRKIINIIRESYNDLSDDEILVALEAEGFTSVVEQLLNERKTGDAI